jgi:GntR family carbon starvation induced transcriptional regulator
VSENHGGSQTQIDTEARTPLSEQAYEVIRNRILLGSLPAETKLKIDVLQRDHQISSSPLREALNRLVAESLVIADERRGFRVAPVTAGDLVDLTAARLVVEPGAFAASMNNGSDRWEARIVAAFHRLSLIEGKIASGAMKWNEEWTARHKDFHISLISECGSERMLDVCARFFDQSERYRRLSASLRRRPRDTTKEHRQLMEAALSRDKNAPTLLRKHIERTTEHVLQALKKSSSNAG